MKKKILQPSFDEPEYSHIVWTSTTTQNQKWDLETVLCYVFYLSTVLQHLGFTDQRRKSKITLFNTSLEGEKISLTGKKYQSYVEYGK